MLVSKGNLYDDIQVLLLNENHKHNPPWVLCEEHHLCSAPVT